MLPCLALIALASTASAQLNDPRLPISLDADYAQGDGKNAMMVFRGLRLNQGAVSIEADEGRASELNFKESVWQLSGNVTIVVDQGRIECDNADLQFRDNLLRVANINGSPATFELTRADSEESTYAEAGTLRYDLDAGSIEFSDNARIEEGGNQIASGYLVYNISEQRIQAQGSEDGDGKVKITFTPKEATEGGEGESPE